MSFLISLVIAIIHVFHIKVIAVGHTIFQVWNIPYSVYLISYLFSTIVRVCFTTEIEV